MPSPRQFIDAKVGAARTLVAWLDSKVDRLNGWIFDEVERSQARAELDAAMFHLYGLSRDETSYIIDTFPIVKRKDEAEFGSYRTKELVLAAYDAMATSKETGVEYRAPWESEATS